MSTVSLEEFLQPISRALGRNQVPERPLGEFDSLRHPHRSEAVLARGVEDLTAEFIREAEKLGILLIQVENDPLKIGVAAASAARQLGGEKAVYPNVSEADACQLEKALQDHEFAVTRWNPSKPEESLQAAQAADVGVTFAAGAIAETASVMQPSSADNGRALALYPTSHVAVLRRSTIRPHMAQALELAAESGTLPSNLTFITGPSSTSDIELVRVVGVHGPVHTAVVIVND